MAKCKRFCVKLGVCTCLALPHKLIEPIKVKGSFHTDQFSWHLVKLDISEITLPLKNDPSKSCSSVIKCSMTFFGVQDIAFLAHGLFRHLQYRRHSGIIITLFSKTLLLLQVK